MEQCPKLKTQSLSWPEGIPIAVMNDALPNIKSFGFVSRV
jgi:hypothetical protein